MSVLLSLDTPKYVTISLSATYVAQAQVSKFLDTLNNTSVSRFTFKAGCKKLKYKV